MRHGWTLRPLLRQRWIPLCSQESGLPLSSFDIVGFTLQYELSFATVLAMLELGGIPLRASERREDIRWWWLAGPVAFAPEPLADFIDAFLIGDGEEAALELCAVVREWKRRRRPTRRFAPGGEGDRRRCTFPSFARARGGRCGNAPRSGSSGLTTGGSRCRTWKSSTTAPLSK